MAGMEKVQAATGQIDRHKHAVRLITAVLVYSAWAIPALGQIRGIPATTPSIVVNFSQLPEAPASNSSTDQEEDIPAPQPIPALPVNGFVATNSEAPASAAPQQAAQPPVPASSSFQAVIDNNTFIPPDTMGAVGPNAVVTILNSQMLIQDRNGNTISIKTLDAFWAPLTGTGNNAFDPRMVYDPYANRWILASVFAPGNSASAILVGVSQTSDPSGSWTLSKVAADAGGTYWADYPTLGFNKDWITVSVNMFPISSGSAHGSQIYVFRKSDLYTNAANIRYTLIADTTSYTYSAAFTYDSSLSTLYLLQNWNGNFNGNGYIRISTITGPVGSEVLNAPSPYPIFVATPNPWDSSGTSAGFAPELGSTNKIDTGDARIYSAVYRNGYLWAAHTVFLPAGAPTRSSIQWWQITPSGSIVQRARIDDPGNATFYAYPSVGVNRNNDAIIGYSRFSASQYPSSDYAFRYSNDAANTVQSDLVFKAGEASYFKTYGGTRNRWGDYSSSIVDPVNDVDLWSIQEYAATPSGGLDRWGTWWTKLTVAVPGVVSVTPINGSGSPQTFNATFSSPSGTAALFETDLLINSSLNGAGACWVYYLPGSNTLRLINDAGTGSVAGAINPGSAGTLSNSQCTVSNAGAVTISGNNLTLPLTITFAPGFVGTRTVYGYASSSAGPASGWQSMGAWTVNSSPPAAVSVSPINGSGSPQTFNATFSSPNGTADISETDLLINSSLNGAGACWVYYLRASNTLRLINDAGSGSVPGSINPGSAGSLSNSQCTVANAGPVTISGNNLTLPLTITFGSGFAGTRTIYALAVNNEGLNSGWHSMGAWTGIPASAPVVVSITPINGSGSPQTFSATFSSNTGTADLSETDLLFNSSFSGTGACWVYYQPGSNSLRLINDAGTASVPGSINPGTAGSLSNSQCTVANAGAVTISGNNLTLPLTITFGAGFTGTNNVYGYASNNEGLSSGWQLLGAWTGH